MIFDLTDNGGGYSEFAYNIMIRPNIDNVYEIEQCILFQNGDNNKSIIQIEALDKIEKLPSLETVEKEDLENMDCFVKYSNKVEPLGEKMLKGRMWMLVDENGYIRKRNRSYDISRTNYRRGWNGF